MTSPGLSLMPEQTGRLAPLTPFYSIAVPVVPFFPVTTMAYSLRLTEPLLGTIRIGSDRIHGGPVRTQAPDSPNLSIERSDSGVHSLPAHRRR